MFLPLRGVRAAARGGAFVAGADDPGALWYNPAGLAELLDDGRRWQLLVDAGLALHDVTYTRIDLGGQTQRPVSSEGQVLPLPTLAAQIDLTPKLALGVGLLAPWSALDGYPEDGAQRYAMVTLHHSVLAMLEAAIAYRATDWLTVGAGVQNLITRFHSRMVFSACPGEIVCAPEDPDFDALGEIDGTSYFTPSAVLGVTLRPTPWLRAGFALQLPFAVHTTGTVRVRLPRSDFFDGAHVEGDRAEADLTFPMMVRGGVEVRPLPRLHLELGIDWERWSQQDEISVTPRDVRVEDAAGVGTYQVQAFSLPRKFENTLALRAGLEVQPLATTPLTLRAGYVHETGASTTSYISVLTVDTSKHILTVGVGFKIGRVRLDGMFGHVFMADERVARGQSCVPQVNPIKDGAPEPACTRGVGDGTYVSSWNLLGLGTAIDF
jgi:long-chain fatty acid transport protein